MDGHRRAERADHSLSTARADSGFQAHRADGEARLNASTLRGTGVWIAFALAMLLAPRVFTSSSAHTALCLMAIAIVLSLSYNMLLGQTGLLSFGHAVYFGLPGFVVIHAMNT